MSIHFAHTIELPQPPARVFAVLDDFAQTPRWLSRCTGIETLTPGPKAAGTKLRYGYKDAGRTGTMDGTLTARVEGERITMHYGDKTLDVTVDFELAPNAGGTKLTHTIDLTPKALMTKLFAPMIAKQVPKQTVTAMESLRALLAQQP
ncbi:MAG TPA: SRPBCC family protein [Polyangia bacterium]|nr:SRPBCC family protein [Polyangia bacterium]